MRISLKKNTNMLWIGILSFMICGLIGFGGCSEDFLKPNPLSFYEPTTTFSTVTGLEAAMAAADRNIRQSWANGSTDYTPIGTDHVFSDLGYYCKTDVNVTGPNFDIASGLTPTGGNSSDGSKISYLWNETFNSIKYANAVTTYVDQVEGLDEATKNAYKGRAYFHHSHCYFRLVFHYGDVPMVSKILEVPKQNYRSTKREAILQMLTERMEFAVQWVPEQADMASIGMVNKGGCRMLLIKCYLATGQWQKAKEQADILIDQSNHSLMQEPFGTWNPGGEPKTWPITRNVIWDLHRAENKLIPANKELIMGMPNRGTTQESFIAFATMRLFGPFWNSTGTLKSPDGKDGVVIYARNNANYDVNYDFGRAFGRNGGFIHPTNFAQYGLWSVNGVEDKDDLRHNSTVGNWVVMDSLKYNEVSSAYYGQNLMLHHPETGALLCSDTIRAWYNWPHYKIFLNDVAAEANLGATQFNGASNGGNADWYLYRLAETYLLRAEAKFYMGDPTAKDDVNEVRKRAKCSQYYTSDVTIGDIMDERARELFMEEFRNVELSRVSYCLALSGKPDEWGNTYDVNTFDKQTGTEPNGGSYWWQRIVHHNNVYNKGPIYSYGKTFNWTLSKHNFYWPIPNSAITANTKGEISQNFGYTGYDPDIPKWETWQEAVADEDNID